MTVMSSSLTSAPSIVRPSSIVRQITSATGQAEQVDFMVSLGCENGSLNSSIFYPRLTYFPTSPRRENAPLRTLNTEEPNNCSDDVDWNRLRRHPQLCLYRHRDVERNHPLQQQDDYVNNVRLRRNRSRQLWSRDG